jgi:hypothetical protein
MYARRRRTNDQKSTGGRSALEPRSAMRPTKENAKPTSRLYLMYLNLLLIFTTEIFEIYVGPFDIKTRTQEHFSRPCDEL